MWKVKKKVSYWYDFQVFAQLVIHCLPFNSLNCANSTIIHSHELSTCRRMLSTNDQFSPWWIWTRISEQKENQLGYRWRQAVWHVVRVNARIIEMLQVVWANSSKKLDYSDQQRLKARNDILIIFHNVNFSVLCMSRVRVSSSTAAFRANSHSKNKFASIDESAVVVFGWIFFTFFFVTRTLCVAHENCKSEWKISGCRDWRFCWRRIESEWISDENYPHETLKMSESKKKSLKKKL